MGFQTVSDKPKRLVYRKIYRASKGKKALTSIPGKANLIKIIVLDYNNIELTTVALYGCVTQFN